MALRNDTTTANANALFETEEETQMNTTTAPAAAAPAVVQPQTTAVAQPVRGFSAALTEYQNAIPLETIAGMGAGGLPRIVADLGGFTLDGDKPLGNQIKIQLLSWNQKFALVTGSTDSEANQYYKVSYDGQFTTDGTPVDEYLRYLKEDKGYDKASKKVYLDLWGYLIHANGKDLAEDDCKTVQVQVAPYSVSKFHAFQVDLGIRKSRGVAVSDIITLQAERGKLGSNSFGYMTFHANK